KTGNVFAGQEFNELNSDSSMEKMYFKQQTNVFRQLPRFGFPYKLKESKDKPLLFDDFRNFEEVKFQKRVKKYGLNEDLIKIKDEFDYFQSEKKKGDAFSKEKLLKLIGYYKKIIDVDYSKVFPIKHILNKDYDELNDLYQDFEKSAYDLSF